MSLKVWLPLNGNVTNQGTLPITLASNSAVVNNTGKIGKCYSFNGSNQLIAFIHDKTIWANKEISIAMWYKYAEGNTTNCMVDIAADLCLSYKYIEGSGVTFAYWRAYSNNGTRTGDSGVLSQYFDADKWHHVVAVYDHNLNKIYVDGNLIETFDRSNRYTTNWTPLLASNYNRITLGKSAGSNPYGSGYLNDVRIYDHALSSLEIRELSQALVCHYKMDCFQNFPNKNILTGTNTQYELIAHNINVNTNAAGKWGYNSGGNGVCSVFDISNDSPDPNITRAFRVENNTTGNRDFQQSLVPYISGATYTASWWARGNCKVFARSWDYDSGTERVYTSYTLNTTEWTYHTWTFTATEFMVTHRCSFHLGVNGGTGTGTIEFCGMKLELGSVATAWCPNPQDEDYDPKKFFDTSVGQNGSKVVDSSGFGNNGTVNGTILQFDEQVENPSRFEIEFDFRFDDYTQTEQTSRYESCGFFDGVNSCVTIPYNAMCPDNIYTFNIWFRKDALGSKGYETLFGGPSGYEIDTRRGSTTYLVLYVTGNNRSTSIPGTSNMSFNEWHMITGSRDGTYERYYLDGEFKGQIEAKGMPNGTYYIGAWSSKTAQNFYGYISDFRLYNTVLSDDDVRRLYQTSMMIDNVGNAHAFEFSDEDASDDTEFSNSLVCNYKLTDNVQTLNNCYSYPTFNTSSASGGWSHWARSGASGTYGQNTDKKYIYNKSNTYSHWVQNASTATAEYLTYQSPDFEGGIRSLQAIIKEENSLPIDESIVFPAWNARNGGTEQNKWTSVIHLGDGFYLCKCEGISQDGSNDLVGMYITPGYKVYFSEAYLENDKKCCSDILHPMSYIADYSRTMNDASIYGSLLASTDSPKVYIPYTTYFNGSSVAYMSGFNIGNVWSAGCWAKVAEDSTTGWKALFILNSTGGDGDTQLGMYINVGTVRMQSSANGKYNSNITVSSSNYWKEWHHYMETFDGTSLKTYFDGVLKNTYSVTASLMPRTNLTIGGRRSGASTFTTLFCGNIYDFRIYDRVLSIDEINAYCKNTPYQYQRVYRNGTVTCDELLEEGFANFHEDGIIESVEFIEI